MTCSPMPGMAPAFGLRGVPMPWVTSSTTMVASSPSRASSVIWTRWPGRAGQISVRPGSIRTEVGRADGEAWPQDRPALGAGHGARGLGGHDDAAERLACSAQLGQDERVFEGALGVEGGLSALQLVEPGRGRNRAVPAGLGKAAVGQVEAEPGERVPVLRPSAVRAGGLGQGVQQRDGVPGGLPGGVQLPAECLGDLRDGAGGAGLVAVPARPVMVADQWLQDGPVESGVGGRSGGRAAQRVLGCERGLQAGHAGGRVDPGELGGEVGVFQRALPGCPLRGEHGGQVH